MTRNRKRLPINGEYRKYYKGGWKVIGVFGRHKIQIYNPLTEEQITVTAGELGRHLSWAQADELNRQRYPKQAKKRKTLLAIQAARAQAQSYQA